MVESMKQVSENYLSTEKGYADDWAAYISSCHMTAEEALDYIRTTNTQEDRAAHLVDMADLSARPYLLSTPEVVYPTNPAAEYMSLPCAAKRY